MTATSNATSNAISNNKALNSSQIDSRLCSGNDCSNTKFTSREAFKKEICAIAQGDCNSKGDRFNLDKRKFNVIDEKNTDYSNKSNSANEKVALCLTSKIDELFKSPAIDSILCNMDQYLTYLDPSCDVSLLDLTRLCDLISFDKEKMEDVNFLKRDLLKITSDQLSNIELLKNMLDLLYILKDEKVDVSKDKIEGLFNYEVTDADDQCILNNRLYSIKNSIKALDDKILNNIFDQFFGLITKPFTYDGDCFSSARVGKTLTHEQANHYNGVETAEEIKTEESTIKCSRLIKRSYNIAVSLSNIIKPYTQYGKNHFISQAIQSGVSEELIKERVTEIEALIFKIQTQKTANRQQEQENITPEASEKEKLSSQSRSIIGTVLSTAMNYSGPLVSLFSFFSALASGAAAPIPTQNKSTAVALTGLESVPTAQSLMYSELLPSDSTLLNLAIETKISNETAKTEKTITKNLQFAECSIKKEITTGKDFECLCSKGANGINFMVMNDITVDCKECKPTDGSELNNIKLAAGKNGVTITLKNTESISNVMSNFRNSDINGITFTSENNDPIKPNCNETLSVLPIDAYQSSFTNNTLNFNFEMPANCSSNDLTTVSVMGGRLKNSYKGNNVASNFKFPAKSSSGKVAVSGGVGEVKRLYQFDNNTISMALEGDSSHATVAGLVGEVCGGRINNNVVTVNNAEKAHVVTNAAVTEECNIKLEITDNKATGVDGLVDLVTVNTLSVTNVNIHDENDHMLVNKMEIKSGKELAEINVVQANAAGSTIGVVDMENRPVNLTVLTTNVASGSNAPIIKETRLPDPSSQYSQIVNVNSKTIDQPQATTLIVEGKKQSWLHEETTPKQIQAEVKSAQICRGVDNEKFKTLTKVCEELLKSDPSYQHAAREIWPSQYKESNGKVKLSHIFLNPAGQSTTSSTSNSSVMPPSPYPSSTKSDGLETTGNGLVSDPTTASEVSDNGMPSYVIPLSVTAGALLFIGIIGAAVRRGVTNKRAAKIEDKKGLSNHLSNNIRDVLYVKHLVKMFEHSILFVDKNKKIGADDRKNIELVMKLTVDPESPFKIKTDEKFNDNLLLCQENQGKKKTQKDINTLSRILGNSQFLNTPTWQVVATKVDSNIGVKFIKERDLENIERKNTAFIFELELIKDVLIQAFIKLKGLYEPCVAWKQHGRKVKLKTIVEKLNNIIATLYHCDNETLEASIKDVKLIRCDLVKIFNSGITEATDHTVSLDNNNDAWDSVIKKEVKDIDETDKNNILRIIVEDLIVVLSSCTFAGEPNSVEQNDKFNELINNDIIDKVLFYEITAQLKLYPTPTPYIKKIVKFCDLLIACSEFGSLLDKMKNDNNTTPHEYVLICKNYVGDVARLIAAVNDLEDLEGSEGSEGSEGLEGLEACITKFYKQLKTKNGTRNEVYDATVVGNDLIKAMQPFVFSCLLPILSLDEFNDSQLTALMNLVLIVKLTNRSPLSMLSLNSCDIDFVNNLETVLFKINGDHDNYNYHDHDNYIKITSNNDMSALNITKQWPADLEEWRKLSDDDREKIYKEIYASHAEILKNAAGCNSISITSDNIEKSGTLMAAFALTYLMKEANKKGKKEVEKVLSHQYIKKTLAQLMYNSNAGKPIISYPYLLEGYRKYLTDKSSMTCCGCCGSSAQKKQSREDLASDNAVVYSPVKRNDPIDGDGSKLNQHSDQSDKDDQQYWIENEDATAVKRNFSEVPTKPDDDSNSEHSASNQNHKEQINSGFTGDDGRSTSDGDNAQQPQPCDMVTPPSPSPPPLPKSPPPSCSNQPSRDDDSNSEHSASNQNHEKQVNLEFTGDDGNNSTSDGDNAQQPQPCGMVTQLLRSSSSREAKKGQQQRLSSCSNDTISKVKMQQPIRSSYLPLSSSSSSKQSESVSDNKEEFCLQPSPEDLQKGIDKLKMVTVDGESKLSQLIGEDDKNTTSKNTPSKPPVNTTKEMNASNSVILDVGGYSSSKV